MIARLCSAFVIADRIQDFLAKLQREVLPSYTSADGILSVLVLQRALIGYNEVMILSIWKSSEAAIQFAHQQPAPTRFTKDFAKDFGIIPKEIVNFDLVSTWASEQSSRDPG